MADFQIKKLETYEYDTRLIDRHLRRGRIQHAEYQQFLGTVTDDADNAVAIEARLGEDSTTIADPAAEEA